MAPPNPHVDGLLALIVSSTKTIEREYAKSAVPSIPTLDTLAPHPFDSQFSSIELRHAIQILEGACAQLTATVARPSHTVVNKFMTIYEPGCIDVVVSHRIPDILSDSAGGLHVTELAKETGLDRGKLGRILRLLASKHCFLEVQEDVFANNRISIQLLSSNPLSSLGLHFMDENRKAAGVLKETLEDPIFGHSYAPEHTPFNKYTGFDKSMFAWFEGATPEGAKQGRRFGRGMIGWGNAIEAASVIQNFPWAQLENGSTVCDLGGGIGTIAMQLAKAYSGLRLKLQDTPERIKEAQTDVWPKLCPQAITENRIEFKAVDFLKESPIKDCDIYYLKNIVYDLFLDISYFHPINQTPAFFSHDWPDKECIQILKLIAAVMSKKSRLLIHEYILQHANRVPDGHSGFAQAPEPLLANYGVGRVRQYNLDLDMMAMLNSQERTLEAFVEMGKDAGLEFVKLWDMGEMGVVEFSLA